LLGFLSNGRNLLTVKLNDTETLRVRHFLDENACSLLLFLETLYRRNQRPAKNIISQDNNELLAFGKLFCETERISDPLLPHLVGVVDFFKPELLAITQKPQKLTGMRTTSNN